MGNDNKPQDKFERNCLLVILASLMTALTLILGWMFVQIDENGDMLRDLQHDFEQWTAGGGR